MCNCNNPYDTDADRAYNRMAAIPGFATQVDRNTWQRAHAEAEKNAQWGGADGLGPNATLTLATRMMRRGY